MSVKVIGIDLGGTNIRAAKVESNGTISERAKIATPSGQGAIAIVDATAELVTKIKKNDEVAAVGLAIANAVDTVENKLSQSPNIPELNDFDFAGALADRVALDIYLENDANAAAVAEHWLGAAKGLDHVICLTLGTGVGGGVIVDGELLRGAQGTAGEIGHICIDRIGPSCGCGSNGCLEQYASGTAIVRMANEALSVHPSSKLNKMTAFSARDVYDSWSQGDEVSAKVFEVVGLSLGTAFATLVNIFNPEMIVVAGGVASAWDAFIGTATSEMRKRAFQQPAERVKIVRGKLGDDAGMLGGAIQAFVRADKGFSRT